MKYLILKLEESKMFNKKRNAVAKEIRSKLTGFDLESISDKRLIKTINILSNAGKNGGKK
jgi:hypothetical protein